MDRTLKQEKKGEERGEGKKKIDAGETGRKRG